MKELNPFRFADGSGMSVRERWVVGLLLLIVAIGLVPESLLNPLRVGLDYSWKFSLNLALLSDREFGTEYLFTYGPLGIFWTRLGTGIPRFTFVLYDLWVWLQWMGILICVLRRRQWTGMIILGAAAILSPHPSRLISAWLGMILIGLESGSLSAFAAAGVSALICFFIKLNYGLILPVVSIGFMGLTVFLRRIRLVPALLLVGVWVVALIAGAAALHVNLGEYLRGGMEIIYVYCDSMWIPISVTDERILPAWVLMSLFGGWVVACHRDWLRSLPHLAPVLLIGLMTVVLYKNGFMRADRPHIYDFYMIFPMLPALLAMASSSWLSRGCRILSVGALVLALVHPAALNGNVGEWLGSTFSVRTYGVQLLSEEAARESCVLAPEDRAVRVLREELLVPLQGRTVDAIPVDSQNITENNLLYAPRPVPQTYQSCSRVLDRMNADWISSSNGAERILYQSKALDGRHPFWDGSITKRVLLTHYDCPVTAETLFDREFYCSRYTDIAEALETGRLLDPEWHYDVAGRSEGRLPGLMVLERRDQSLGWQEEDAGEVTLHWGEMMPLPQTHELLYGTAEVLPSLWGRLRNLFFQPGEVRARLEYANGSIEEFRTTPELLRTGVLLNRKVSCTEEAADFFHFRGTRGMGVKSITFLSPQPTCFRPEIRMKLQRCSVVEPAVQSHDPLTRQEKRP